MVFVVSLREKLQEQLKQQEHKDAVLAEADDVPYDIAIRHRCSANFAQRSFEALRGVFNRTGKVDLNDVRSIRAVIDKVVEELSADPIVRV